MLLLLFKKNNEKDFLSGLFTKRAPRAVPSFIRIENQRVSQPVFDRATSSPLLFAVRKNFALRMTFALHKLYHTSHKSC